MSDGLQPAATAVEGVGAVLQAERRRQNLSLGDVSRHLKLSVRQVEALERDDFSPFGGEVFVHGFIRNYSKLLGLDAGPLLQAADAKMMPPEPPVAEARSEPGDEAQPKRHNYAAAGLLAFVLVAGGVGLYTQQTKAPEPSPGSAPESAMVTPEAAVPETVATPGAVDQLPARPALAPPANVAAGENGKLGVLRMVFDQESWVEVTDSSGTPIFAQLNPAGARRKVSGQPPLSVVVGNAAGVRLSYNDREVDLSPHTRVDVARLTLE
jgi:cytoskeleton protein RodZ